MSGSQSFLVGTSEMAQRMRAFDWTTTPLGEPEHWPPGLRTAVRLLLNTGHPMHIFWGEEAVFFYNDSFIPSAGPERHPSALGLPASETWGEIWPVIGAEIAKVRTGGEHTWYEDRHVPILRDGRLEDAYWTYGFSPIHEETAPNGIGGVISILTETTRRKELESHLRGLNETLQAQVDTRTTERNRIWQVSRDMLLVSDTAGVWLEVNPAWTRLLGWTEAELIGWTSEWLEHPADVAKTRAEIRRLAQGMATLTFENRLRGRDGQYCNLLWTGVRDGDRFYCVAHDITELRRTEEALRQSQKMEAVGQLTGGLAHDFNNLLTGISGSLEFMQTRMRQGRQADVDRYMVVARGAVRRAAALTHRLLAFSRRQTLAPKPTDVTQLATGLQELVQRTVGPTILVEVIGAPDTWPVLVDQSQLENALLNLCINARDAMPDGGRIKIATANERLDEQAAREQDLVPGQYLSLCVTDTGTGMPPEVIAHVFEPFFTTKPLGAGTGLGLSMIYGFARQSGGQVRVRSEVGRGTTVCIFLPRHHGEVAEDGGMAAPADLRRLERNETVLVVDDEPTVRMLITDILEDLGYTAIEAGDSAAGLAVLQSDQRIDLLITDVGLPGGMNGRQMVDAARVSRPHLKVLFITGYAESVMVGKERLAPGMAVLTKPFAVDAIACRIRSMIDGEEESSRRF